MVVESLPSWHRRRKDGVCTTVRHLIGTRVGTVVARTIRRLPTSEREDSSVVVATRGTHVAGRPAEAAAGDAPTVTRQAVLRKEVIVVLCNLWRTIASGQRRRRQCTSKSSSKLAQADCREDRTIIGSSGKQPASKFGKSCFFWS